MKYYRIKDGNEYWHTLGWSTNSKDADEFAVRELALLVMRALKKRFASSRCKLVSYKARA